MNIPKKVLVAGATGYLGSHIVSVLKKRGDYQVLALVRNHESSGLIKDDVDEMRTGELSKPETIQGICKGVDIVISTVGITKQREGLTYNDVDYQANINILEEAKKSSVKKFVYVSVFDGEAMTDLKMVKAKLKFAKALEEDDIDHLIVNPNGFFSDMGEFLKMAKQGRVYLFGDGEYKINPIDGSDLAGAIVDAMDKDIRSLDVGGPEVLSHNELARLAFEVTRKPLKISYIPIWIKSSILWLLRTFTSVKTYGPIEFFMTVLSRDMVAPKYGKRRLKDYLVKLNNNNQ